MDMPFAPGAIATTKVAELAPLDASLPIASRNAVVAKPTLTLSSMQAAVDAIESAEGRAKTVLGEITRSFGKDGTSWFTKFQASPLAMATTAALGLAAGYAVFHHYFPESANYYRTYRNGWTHHATGSWYYWDAGKAVLGILTAAGVGVFGSEYAFEKTAQWQKARMARALLDGPRMQPFVELLDGAQERPLERAAIAKVARTTLEQLSARQIFCSPEAKAPLLRSIEDEGLGDEGARDELVRHRAVIDAVRGLETNKGEMDQLIAALKTALDALPEDQRSAVAKDVYDRLFDNYVPLYKHIDYTASEKLTAMLG